MTEDQEASNNRVATKRMGMDIHRVLARWDPLSLKGLRGAEREYDQYVGPLVIMVKKGAEPMEIARHLSHLLTGVWGLPTNNAKCVEIAQKIHNAGALMRGEIG